jgi:hypothetical protein
MQLNTMLDMSVNKADIFICGYLCESIFEAFKTKFNMVMPAKELMDLVVYHGVYDHHRYDNGRIKLARVPFTIFWDDSKYSVGPPTHKFERVIIRNEELDVLTESMQSVPSKLAVEVSKCTR